MPCSGNSYFNMAEHKIYMGMREVPVMSLERSASPVLEWSMGDEVAYRVTKCRDGSKMHENRKTDGAC